MITTKVEAVRGCGYRKPGGMYLVSGGLSARCSRLPIKLTVCPCCGAGIKFSRGFTWIGKELILEHQCQGRTKCQTPMCSLNEDRIPERVGLMWIGEKYYSPSSFRKEALRLGVSKRIGAIPKDLVVGETVILLAHRKGHVEIVDGSPVFTPAIIMAFTPTAIEYVLKGDETPEELDRLQERGLTLIKSIKDIDAQIEIK